MTVAVAIEVKIVAGHEYDLEHKAAMSTVSQVIEITYINRIETLKMCVGLEARSFRLLCSVDMITTELSPDHCGTTSVSVRKILYIFILQICAPLADYSFTQRC